MNRLDLARGIGEVEFRTIFDYLDKEKLGEFTYETLQSFVTETNPLVAKKAQEILEKMRKFMMKFEIDEEKFKRQFVDIGIDITKCAYITKQHFQEVFDLYATQSEVEIIFEYLDEIKNNTVPVKKLYKELLDIDLELIEVKKKVLQIIEQLKQYMMNKNQTIAQLLKLVDNRQNLTYEDIGKIFPTLGPNEKSILFDLLDEDKSNTIEQE